MQAFFKKNVHTQSCYSMYMYVAFYSLSEADDVIKIRLGVKCYQVVTVYSSSPLNHLKLYNTT